MPRRPSRPSWKRLAAVAVACGLLTVAVFWTNVLGAGDRAEALARRIELVIDPPPDRPIDEDVLVTPAPDETLEATPAPTPAGTVQPSTGSEPPAEPTPTATPLPKRTAVDVNLFTDPERRFITEIDHEWCAVAGTQMVLAAHGKAPLTEDFQKVLAGRIGEWESRRDSHNGGWGPSAITKALAAYGVDGYEVHVYETRADALRDAARAIETTNAPVLLMAWRGAHTWVMTGFRADADPLVFADAKVSGTYVLDPWYPRDSSIWGQSDPPGTFQDQSEMRRNYLPWHRPEGNYAKRDGLFLAVVPTIPRN